MRNVAAAVFGGRPGRGHVALLIVVAAWAFVPVVAVLVRVGVNGGTPSGVDGPGLIDQFQYLAWIRESGEDGLISNRFDLEPDRHAYLHPLFVLSGLAWALGVPVQFAFLAWKPVTLLLLFAGFMAYARRLLPETGRAIAGAALALFFFPPLTPLGDWTGLTPQSGRFPMELFGFELFPGNYLWGHPSTAIAVGLMPLCFLWTERALRPGAADAGRWALAAGASGAIASWAHPWQGAVVIAVLVAVAAWRRSRRAWVLLAAVAGATLAPLLYYLALSRSDSAWSEGYERVDHAHHLGWLVVCVAPLAALAVVGALRRGQVDRPLEVQELIVRIWPLATLAVYVALDKSFFYNVLSGASLPLAVLSVRAFPWSAPRWRAATAALVGVMTLPGLIHVADGFRDSVRKDEGPYWFEPDERRALDYLDDQPGDGGVLSRVYLGSAVPAFTGRSTWVGHPSWTPDYERRVNAAEDLMEGRLGAGEARRLVHGSGAAYVLTDCSLSPDLAPVLGDGARVVRFGCAAVYELEPGASAQRSAR